MARKATVSPLEARVMRGALAVTRSFAGAWNGVASILGGWIGAYPSADPRRKILEDWRPRTATANQALVPSLSVLVAQLRHLDRSAPTLRGIVAKLQEDVDRLSKGCGLGTCLYKNRNL